MTAVATAGRHFNKAAMPLVKKFSRWPAGTGSFGMGIVTYQGRRSGRTFSLVVGFRRTGSGVAITVEIPDQKRWWRNFVQESGPATLEVGGTRYAGQARAHRTDNGEVRVDLDLD